MIALNQFYRESKMIIKIKPAQKRNSSPTLIFKRKNKFYAITVGENWTPAMSPENKTGRSTGQFGTIVKAQV